MKEKISLRESVILVCSMFVISAVTYYIMVPGTFIFGGVTGLAVILLNFLHCSFSTLIFVINGALLVIGFLLLGKDFGIKTVIASLLNPVFLRLFEWITPNPQTFSGDKAIDMMILVIVLSFGQALLFSINASSGGLDIVAKLMNKYMGLKVGTSLAILGYMIVASSIVFYDKSVLVTSFLTTYLNGLVMDNFSDGFRIRKKICIITNQCDKVKDYIIHEMHRGVTLYETTGGYNGEKRVEIVTVMEKREYGKLLQYLGTVDQNAFVTVTTISEVMGYWIKK